MLALTIIPTGAAAQAITAGQHTRVETTNGPIEGYQDGRIFTFKGIRYAKAERFMPPERAARDDGCHARGIPLREARQQHLARIHPHS